MKNVDEMSVFRFSVAITVMFILGFLLSSLIKWEDCQMFNETSFFGTKYECKVKQ
jgi:hypothetical protein